MRTIELRSGQRMPVLGQGTWGFGERGKFGQAGLDVGGAAFGPHTDQNDALQP